MILWIIRAFYIVTLAGVAAVISRDFAAYLKFANFQIGPTLLFVGISSFGLMVLGLDIFYAYKRIREVSAIYFGLFIGILLSQLLTFAVGPTLDQISGEANALRASFSFLSTTILCYLCVSILLQTKDDFRFIIPYIEFRRQLKGIRPIILDTGAIIDGRVADIAEVGLFDQPLVIPRFVLHELQAFAESSDRIRRNRGRRGLDVVDRLQHCTSVEIQMHDTDLDSRLKREMEQKMLVVAEALHGKILTMNANLIKLANIQSVETINLNDLGNAARSPVMHGDTIAVKLIKEGEEPGQGIGYLDDGTMVVVEMGKRFVGHEINLIVNSVLQTNNGRMVFGRIDSRNPDPATSAHSHSTHSSHISHTSPTPPAVNSPK